MMHASVEAPVYAMLLPTMLTSVASVAFPLISELRFHSVVSAMADLKTTVEPFRDFCVDNAAFTFYMKGQYCLQITGNILIVYKHGKQMKYL
jgi:hypothetical protein